MPGIGDHDGRIPQDPPALLLAWLQASQEAGYWKAQFEAACRRETKKEEEIKRLQAQVTQLQHQLFGKKSEKKRRSKRDAGGSASGEGQATPRKRGQQPGNPAPLRRNHQHLPVVEEFCELPEDQRHCPLCGLPFADFPRTVDCEIIEIEVHAYRRRYRRRQYRATCQCPGTPAIVLAPKAPKLIPKGRYGISVWTMVVLDKFLFYRPSHRLIADLATQGIHLPPGTLADGLKRLTALLTPLYEAIRCHCQEADHWHADETGWKVFVAVADKPDHKRTLWVYRSAEAVFFALALTKGSKEAEGFFGPDAQGILSADRASHYKALTAVERGSLLIAFCWAHMRRDFVDAARANPSEQTWAQSWLDRIGELFDINRQRVEAWCEECTGPAFATHDARLRSKLEEFCKVRDEELQHPNLSPLRQRILTSLVKHWQGLTIFVEHPEVPMDNTEAERKLGGPAMGRKNFWGSAAIWAGELAERCFTLFATLLLAEINVRTWLTAYFTACAGAGGKAPSWAEQLLPWNLSETQRAAFQQPLLGGKLAAEVQCCLAALAAVSLEVPPRAELLREPAPLATLPMPRATSPPSFSAGTRPRRPPVFPRK